MSPSPAKLARHGGGNRETWIHMNAAGCAPVAAETHAALVSHLELEQKIGGYAAKARSTSDARSPIARLLGCDAEEIALVDSAQAAWSRAFYSLDFRAGDRILCFESEYAGNAVAYLQMAKRTGVSLQVLPMCGDGIADLRALEEALRSPPAGAAQSGQRGRVLVALTHVQTDSSIVQPAARVGALCANYDALFLLDSCQSVGQMPVNVRSIGCDFACGTGRKWLRGPRGTGFLYARRETMHRTGGAADLRPGPRVDLVGEPPMIDHACARWTTPQTYELLPDARRYEMWEASEALRHGLAVAAELCAAAGPQAIFDRAASLARRLREGLEAVNGCVIRDVPAAFDEERAAEAGAARCALVLFEVASTLGVDAATIKAALEQRQIAASVSPGDHHFDSATRDRPPAVRLSPSYYNTEAEVDAVLEAIRDILAQHAAASKPVP